MIYTAEQLTELLREHQAWLSGEEGGKRANLGDANLRAADLRAANLRDADLGDADLGDADLRDADLRGANLRGADLRGANLRCADLGGANLGDANLGDADLGVADLGDADLRGADLRGANLGDADLSGANLILIGQDIRGYLFWAYRDGDEVIVRAGCRRFALNEAKAHWGERHTADPVLREDCLSLIDRCERMARARRWI